MDSILRAPDLNFFINKTTNIRKKRVINFYYYILKTAIIIEGGFYLKANIDIARIIDSKL